MSIDELLEQLEELLEYVEDLQTLRDFADRVDALRNGVAGGQEPDPLELARLLADILEYLAGKIPLGPYAFLVRRALEFIERALESNIRLVLSILWGIYRRWRESDPDMTHERANALTTEDDLVCAWLRLRWIRERDIHESDSDSEPPPPSAGEDHHPEPPGPGIIVPAGPRWPIEHHECCSQKDGDVERGALAPTVLFGNVSWEPPSPADGHLRRVNIELKMYHPCGLQRSRVRVFVSAKDQWIELKMGTHNCRVRRHDDHGVKRTVSIIGLPTVRVIVQATSNCGTHVRLSQEFVAP
jgi:hypothetical protein